MNSREAYYFIHQRCNTLYDEQELDEISWRILEHVSKKSKMDLKLNPEIDLIPDKLEFIVRELLKNRPIQYILGYEFFGHLKLKVNESVLIPRPETEELTRILLKTIKDGGQADIHILDIGTGSGCIPILIKNEMPAYEVYGLDISPEALAVAAENAARYNTNIHLIEADILKDDLQLTLKFDYIISNPPYIALSEKVNMHSRVYLHEPGIALFAPGDPLIFYRAILLFAKLHLKEKGMIFLELNNLYAESVKQHFETENFSCEILTDLFGNARFLVAKSSF